MLALEVEDINCEDDLIKEPIFLGSQMFLQATVIVEEDHCWKILPSEIIDGFQKVLYYIVVIFELCEESRIHTFTPDIASAPNMVERAAMTPQQQTTSCSLCVRRRPN